ALPAHAAPPPPPICPSAGCASSPAGGWSPATRYPTPRTHPKADSAATPPATGSTTGCSTAVRSPSGSSATASAPPATASGTAPSPGETHEPHANGHKRQAGPETQPPRHTRPGPNQGPEMLKVTHTPGLCA